MKSVLASVVALSLAASSAFAQFTINTPASAVVCQPLLINWIGGSAPYFLSILPGNQPGAAALVTFPQTNATSVTWLVNIAAQTSLGLSIRDSTGALVQSAPFSVQPGPDSSCVGQSSSITFGSTAPAGATTTGQGASTTGAVPTTTQLTPGTSVSSPQTSAASGTSKASTGTSTGTASSPTKSSGATRVSGQIAAAGIVGAAMIALLG